VTCPWCDGGCAGIDLTPVLDEHVAWFWRQLAETGDRRGDVDLVTGYATVRAPVDPTARAAALGLLGGRTPSAGQPVRVNLADLVARIRVHHPDLTPGIVAAHAMRRRLGERVRGDAERRDAVDRLRRYAIDVFAALPAPPDLEVVWPLLRRTGWVARLLASGYPERVVDQAAAVIAALPAPGERRDRRRLADEVTRFPHALDEGLLPGLVLAILTAASVVPAGVPTRAAWAAVGVDCDDLTGGLLALGIHPDGWSLPAGAVVTVPPRELARCAWPAPPGPDAWVYVTENPSVVGAAANVSGARLLCTVGTPSGLEIGAIARLAARGWRVAARADFDEAGLAHVHAILRAVPDAQPWRMGAGDYLASIAGTPPADRARLRAVPDTPWDPALQYTMKSHGVAAYEETLIDVLLGDLARQ
jgi:uncharacterized protein (TIGR02679 family)